MYAAVAAGKENGGYRSIQDAVLKMARLKEKTFIPNNNDKKTYNRVYSEFTLLHDYFGYGHNNAMKRLRNLTRFNHRKEKAVIPITLNSIEKNKCLLLFMNRHFFSYNK